MCPQRGSERKFTAYPCQASIKNGGAEGRNRYLQAETKLARIAFSGRMDGQVVLILCQS